MGVTVWMWMSQGVRDGLSKWQSLMSPSLAQHQAPTPPACSFSGNTNYGDKGRAITKLKQSCNPLGNNGKKTW